MNMALKKGKSDETISENIKKLMDTKPDKTRDKAIKTLSKRKHIPYRKAMQKLSIAIAYSKAGRSKKKK